jgi:NAD(P)-dependent dehydrogenase (short-subunit alcohol dehydrogenase family)
MRTLNDLMNLDGRTALVTGACGFLGSVICETLAEQGCDLILLDLPDSNFQDLHKRIKKQNDVKIYTIESNLEDSDSRASAITKVLKEHKKLNILINTAALVGSTPLDGWATSFKKQSLETWDRAFNVNLVSVFHLARDLFPLIKKSGHGSIINIGSIYGVTAPDYSLYESEEIGNPAAYSSSKGGLIQFTKWLSTTLAHEIRVNCISPGGILRDQSSTFISKYEQKTPLKRMAHEEDFKGIIAYLASDLSEYVTGQNIMIDGGWTVW